MAATVSKDYSDKSNRIIWTIGAVADTVPEIVLDHSGDYTVEVISASWGGTVFSVLASHLTTPTVALMRGDGDTTFELTSNSGVLALGKISAGCVVKPKLTGGTGTDFTVILAPVV